MLACRAAWEQSARREEKKFNHGDTENTEDGAEKDSAAWAAWPGRAARY
jgi:hypothetical protein